MKKQNVMYAKLSKELNALCLRKETISRKSMSLGRIECDLLQYLNEVSKPVCMNDISEKIGVSHSRITRLIDTLVEKGLVERYPSRRDRRSWLGMITPKGKDVANETVNDMILIQKKLLQLFPENEVESIYEHILLYLKTYNELLESRQFEDE